MSGEWDNVILLSADALRADHLSYHGYHRDTSPVLDELAEESRTFMNCYSASSHTREAVPALLTGEYPDVAIDSNYRLATDTIALTLSEEGFATGGFHSNPYVSRAYGFDEGFDKFDDDLHLGQHRFIALAQRAWDKIRGRHYARAEEINRRSLNWIDSLDDEPFFLWNHYMDTHGPYEPPGEYATLYSDDGGKGKDVQSLYQRAIDDPDSITDEERQLLIDLYDGEITYNDMRIGEFLAELRKRDLLENSLLIFTADHGDAFYEHGYYEHPRYLHDEITHVPMLVRTPDGESGDVDAAVSTLDVRSTVEGEVGGSDGVSLFEEISTERTVFSQARGEYENDHLWRYAARQEGEVCLCERHRETDEVEFTGEASRGLRNELEEYVQKRVRRMNGEDLETEDEADAEIERRLEALGYKE